MAMTEEARRFVSDLVWNDRNFTELFTADYGYVNGDLARIYGVEAPATDFDRVPFPADSERAGLLGQALFLDLDGQAGRHVADRARPLRSRAVPLPARGRSAARSEHQPAAGHRSEADDQPRPPGVARHEQTCAGCHNLVDPIGFGFEKFDAIGQRRDKLKLTFGRGRRGEGQNRQRKIDYRRGRARYQGPGGRYPQLEFLVAQRTGRGAGGEPAVPGMHREAVFPLRGRPHAKPPADRPRSARCWKISANPAFSFKEMIVSMMVRARNFPAQGGQVQCRK